MDNTILGKEANTIVGIPYKNINWNDIPGQPFGLASQFNLFIFGDANNIVDVEGAMAVGGSFYSTRSLSVGYDREKGQIPIEYSPDLVRYLVGDNVSMKGPLGVIGHAVSGGSFRAAPGSTYYIGKNNSNNQLEELSYLYQANGGSPYWMPSEKSNYYIISSYDVPRIIPASRISADVSAFFDDARKSIETFKNCIERLSSNGTVTSNSYEWILTGTDPKQNIFTLDVRPNGILNKGIRFNIPEGSLAVVRLRTGPHAHLQSGLYGEERLANHILYVFEDATNIHMENSSDIWGSILAPQAMFHGHPTGGHVSGNGVLGGFAVNPNSGFEFHLYPFVGGINCMNTPPSQIAPEIIETPSPNQGPSQTPEETPSQTPNEAPSKTPGDAPSDISGDILNKTPVPSPAPCPTCPEQRPCPTCPVQIPSTPCPEQRPCPACPEQIPSTPCPEQTPCPTCPVQTPCPTCPEQTPCPTCPSCPDQVPCPTCPSCPEPLPCPSCPEQIPCPTCPSCPEPITKYIPVPIPIRTECKVPNCPVCQECLITQGIISGCILGCDCCRNHDWDIMLYQVVDGRKRLIYCITICHLGCFKFKVDYDESYILKICPIKRNCNPNCRPKISFNNIGVSNLILK